MPATVPQKKRIQVQPPELCECQEERHTITYQVVRFGRDGSYLLTVPESLNSDYMDPEDRRDCQLVGTFQAEDELPRMVLQAIAREKFGLKELVEVEFGRCDFPNFMAGQVALTLMLWGKVGRGYGKPTPSSIARVLEYHEEDVEHALMVLERYGSAPATRTA